MSLRKFVPLVALMTTGLLTLPFSKVGAQQPRSVRVDFGKKDIAGVVTSSKGLEAGVWVIAETTELPTKFVRIVVTDDQGRYLIPDLPQANYQIFVRGYGLLDSRRQPAKPGQQLDLKADAKAAPVMANLTLGCSTTIAGMAYSHPPVAVTTQVQAGK